MRRIVGAVLLATVAGLTACTSGGKGSAAPTSFVPNRHQHVYVVGGENMERTLHGCQGCHGDHVVFDLLAGSNRRVHDGDIVVFLAPSGWDLPGRSLISRIIATGGQTIKGDAAGHVMVSASGANGPFHTLHEPYVFIDAGQRGTLRPFGPVTVPTGRVWVMGDHRNDSADSRYHCGPHGADATNDWNCNPTGSTVPLADVIGIAAQIVAPPNRVRRLG